ncbi:hypothetical protein B0H16DRAFT_1473371 [Mycena metata]|uniref:Uncharacterized protein n=1 Tax=Mycena metata TaxID=1033252 RepID=A0AAD7ML24_9AGAR|nr:hypothetical protein B0H16DRAFT_1473371 [Mycena metata]
MVTDNSITPSTSLVPPPLEVLDRFTASRFYRMIPTRNSWLRDMIKFQILEQAYESIVRTQDTFTSDLLKASPPALFAPGLVQYYCFLGHSGLKFPKVMSHGNANYVGFALYPKRKARSTLKAANTSSSFPLTCVCWTVTDEGVAVETLRKTVFASLHLGGIRTPQRRRPVPSAAWPYPVGSFYLYQTLWCSIRNDSHHRRLHLTALDIFRSDEQIAFLGVSLHLTPASPTAWFFRMKDGSSRPSARILNAGALVKQLNGHTDAIKSEHRTLVITGKMGDVVARVNPVNGST